MKKFNKSVLSAAVIAVFLAFAFGSDEGTTKAAMGGYNDGYYQTQGYSKMGEGSRAYPDKATCALVCKNEGYTTYLFTGSPLYQCYCK